jgi:hypothetical protein
MEPIPPALRAEGLAGRVIRELGLGVGERVSATVLSQLEDGRFEVRLGSRVVQVQSSQRLEVGASLMLSVREAGSRLLLEILEHRPTSAPDPGEALGGRLKSLGIPDDPARREALAVLMEGGVPVTRKALEAVVAATEAFPGSEALARRAAAFLLAGGGTVEPADLQALLEALRGGSLAEAASALERAGVPDLLGQGPWSAPGPAAQALARAALEDAVASLLGKDGRLAVLDLARSRLGPVSVAADGKPEAEALARRLLAIPPGPHGDAESARLLAGVEPGTQEALARSLARREAEALGTVRDLPAFREAHQALLKASGEEAGRLLLGRDGVRHAEGVFRPPDSPPIRLRVSARQAGKGKGKSGDKGKHPLRVAVALQLSALGSVGAELSAEGKRLHVSLWAQDPSAEAALRGGMGDLTEALRKLGFEPAVSVARASRETLAAAFPGVLGIGEGPAPLVDLKA